LQELAAFFVLSVRHSVENIHPESPSSTSDEAPAALNSVYQDLRQYFQVKCRFEATLQTAETIPSLCISVVPFSDDLI
jgi:hypothetical protein